MTAISDVRSPTPYSKLPSSAISLDMDFLKTLPTISSPQEALFYLMTYPCPKNETFLLYRVPVPYFLIACMKVHYYYETESVVKVIVETILIGRNFTKLLQVQSHDDGFEALSQQWNSFSELEEWCGPHRVSNEKMTALRPSFEELNGMAGIVLEQGLQQAMTYLQGAPPDTYFVLFNPTMLGFYQIMVRRIDTPWPVAINMIVTDKGEFGEDPEHVFPHFRDFAEHLKLKSSLQQWENQERIQADPGRVFTHTPPDCIGPIPRRGPVPSETFQRLEESKQQ